MPIDMPNDSYEMRLARQAVRVSRLWGAYQREMDRMDSIIRGTPPTITDNEQIDPNLDYWADKYRDLVKSLNGGFASDPKKLWNAPDSVD